MKTKIPLLFVAVALLLAGVWTGCQSRPAPQVSAPSAVSTRNNSYSLLHQLLSQQKDVSLLRFIKKEHSDVKELLKKIASTSGAGADMLEDFAKHDRTIQLDAMELPPGEMATRAAMASAKQKDILGHKGDEFELTLLLTQTEALNYAAHLAEVASEHEPQPDRAQALAKLGKEMEQYYNDVFLLLLSKTK